MILGDSTLLAVSRLDDSTVAVTLPEGPTSPVKIFDKDGAKRWEAGEVQRVGMRSRQEAPGMYGELYPVRNDLNQQGFLGATWIATDPGDLAFLSPATLLLTTFPGLSYPGAIYGVGLTPNPSRFIVKDTAGLINEWNIFPTPVLADSLPPAAGSPRQIARLSDSVWLYTSSHYSYTRKADLSQPYFGAAESPGSLHLSPRGDRALTSSNGYAGLSGIPVFDNQSGDTAYTIPVSIPGQQPSNEYAVFSSGGEYLTVLSGPYGAPNLVIRVDAASGAILASDSLPAGSVGIALALDGSESQLLAYALRDKYPVLYVLDAVTLARQGTLSVPEVAENECDPAFFYCWDSAIIVDDAAHIAYIAIPWDITRLYGFDLLP